MVRLYRPEERLDAISISNCDKKLCLFVVEDARKLASKVVDEVEAMVFVQGDDDLRVGSRGELVVGGVFDLLANVVVVVELAVDDGVDLAVRRVKRLSSIGGEVVDCQPHMAESW